MKIKRSCTLQNVLESLFSGNIVDFIACDERKLQHTINCLAYTIHIHFTPTHAHLFCRDSELISKSVIYRQYRIQIKSKVSNPYNFKSKFSFGPWTCVIVHTHTFTITHFMCSLLCFDAEINFVCKHQKRNISEIESWIFLCFRLAFLFLFCWMRSFTLEVWWNLIR